MNGLHWSHVLSAVLIVTAIIVLVVNSVAHRRYQKETKPKGYHEFTDKDGDPCVAINMEEAIPPVMNKLLIAAAAHKSVRLKPHEAAIAFGAMIHLRAMFNKLDEIKKNSGKDGKELFEEFVKRMEKGDEKDKQQE